MGGSMAKKRASANGNIVTGKAPASTPHLWQSAVSFSARAHRHQIRRDGFTPYFAHPVRVMMTVVHVFGCTDEVVLCAALLHDTIEDTTTDYDDLAERFGTGVADLVAVLTKNMAMPEPEREREYDARLAKADWRARLVKLADVYDNLCDVHTSPAEKVAKKRADAIEKCHRALHLARGDEKVNETTRRATTAIRELVRANGG